MPYQGASNLSKLEFSAYCVRRMIRASDQRPGLHMRKAHRLARNTEVAEFLRSHVADDRQMLRGRPQILPQRENTDPMGPQISHDLEHFLRRLSQSQHQAGLGRR